MKPRILIIDDDASILELLQSYIGQKTGYIVHTAGLGETGLKLFCNIKPSLVLLDLSLPDISGWEVIKCLRQNENIPYTPVILMTANYTEPISEILALKDYQADDYLRKPFNLEILLARVKAVLRRLDWESGKKEELGPLPEVLSITGLKILLKEHRVLCREKEITLTRMEFELLTYLLKNKNKLLRKKEILEEVWKYTEEIETRTLDRHIHSVREKLGNFGARIVTIFGEGYRFEG